MRHRVDPDALFGFVLNRWGLAVAAQVCPEVEPERPAEPVMTAPADDPRRLTYGEISDVLSSCPYLGNARAVARAVADAQLKKADLVVRSAACRSKGVEVTA